MFTYAYFFVGGPFLIFKKYFIYLFLDRGKGGKKRNINVWLSLTHPLLGTWPAT